MEQTKRCSKCSETLSIVEFYRRSNRPSGHESQCKGCSREAVVKRHATAKGAKARRKSVKRYSKTDKRRATGRAYLERRKELQALATPRWAPLHAIAAFYSEAERLTLESGVKHEVHHIMPIAEFGALFNGLHVPWNLEILEASEHTQAHVELRQTYSRAHSAAKRRLTK